MVGNMGDMEFHEVVRRRRMVRNFDDRAVPPDVVERLLINATKAPSAGFTQGCDLLVLEGPEQTGRFWASSEPPDGDGSRTTWPGVLRAPLLIVVLASEAAYRARYSEPDKQRTPSDGQRWRVPYWHVDAGFAALLALLTAVDEGLGALFFGVTDADGFRAEFGIPDSHVPVGAIAAGYARPDRPSSSAGRRRRPLDEVVHRGSW